MSLGWAAIFIPAMLQATVNGFVVKLSYSIAKPNTMRTAVGDIWYYTHWLVPMNLSSDVERL